MTRKFREFKKSLSEEKARVKLYKSGKNWVKAGIKEFQLLKALGLSFLSHDIVKDENGEVTTQFGEQLKKNVLRTTAFAGGMFTVNMLHDQQAFAASDAPITSELATKSQTIGDQTSIVIEKSTSSDQSTNSIVESESKRDSESISLSEHQTSESTSLSTSTSKSMSTSVEESESTSKDSHTKTQDSQSDSHQSTSQEVNGSSNHEQSTPHTAQSLTSLSIDSQTSTSNTSLKETKEGELSKNLSKLSQNQNIKLHEEHTMRSADLNSGYTGFRAAYYAPRSRTTPTTKVYTGQGSFRGRGRIKYNIFYKVVVTSNGKEMKIRYTLSQDDPNTSNVEKPRWAGQRRFGIHNTWDAGPGRGQLKLGSAFGKPTVIQGETRPNYGSWIGTPITKYVSGDRTNGFYWQAAVLAPRHGEKGEGITAEITVPIVNPSGRFNWEFHPVGQQDGVGGKTDYFENVWIRDYDPYYKYIHTSAGRASVSNSISQVKASESRSTSLIQSESIRRSQSISESESIVAASHSASVAKSQSISRSQSVAKSQSISRSQSIAHSRSASVAKSQSISRSQSIAHSRSASVAESQSISRSQSIAHSQSVAASESESLSTSLSKKQSISMSNSESAAKSHSLSVRRSNWIKKSKAASVRKSHSLSVRKSNSAKRSHAISVRKSKSLSVKKSISQSQSASVAKSQSISRSQSVAASESASLSKSKSTSLSNSASAEKSTSLSRSASVAKSQSISRSQSVAASESAS
ncbi:KxYKxGKxW signal peptide domain-containing protein, partial [Staphylococcus pseudintermedius]|uniref:KxYKxGKxW signal peptide domain-containing protein n=1 Tax=Staphylococcus pseudintermedius TaxID=283734 RepID=UPI001C200180|nr:KxYKxGKxW signal peptide domain-containing protein [Staphylococcus pseudintermedius]